ncbi:MAG TPA: methylmalonyl Co-A mutase-associated GTPase MeaB [Brevefilum sp.]|nr:methylmalonyl Co-A mutase-associated GTPase MeaB [Brevefilum sp.]HOR19120.1 methylmalonyl Co-A mutase-associated GTPase MeaB [Brevefilum sp.]HPL69659.1 methylmalonyl Co-A mutase-associated GTPase MeaB [Brevefilum sp.]
MIQIDPIAIRQGDRLALSRALTVIENNAPESRDLQSALFPFTGQAHLIGVTGSAGSGKSTLVNQLTKHFRQGQDNQLAPKVAIIAVDPSSPFTGGALLGDRIRMGDLAGDKGIFIRSMASRGALGGLANQTAAFVTVLDSAGFDLIIIETVGAGQAEVDIASLAHTVIVVEAPGMGDDIQAIKAGILEIADIIVVNKADRPGAENTIRALRVMLEMAQRKHDTHAVAGKHLLGATPTPTSERQQPQSGWLPTIHSTTAIDGKGIAPLIDDVQRHRQYLTQSGEWQQKEASRLRRDVHALIRDALLTRWWKKLDENQFAQILDDVIQRKYSPIEAVEKLL